MPQIYNIFLTYDNNTKITQTKAERTTNPLHAWGLMRKPKHLHIGKAIVSIHCNLNSTATISIIKTSAKET